MKAKSLIGGLILLAAVVILSGCSSIAPISSPSSGILDTNTPTTPVLPSGQKPPDTSNWISPAKVNLGNFHVGANAEYPITVHNGNSKPSKFLVQLRVADYTSAGYAPAPLDVLQDWVLIADSTPVLNALETRDIIVVITMPSKPDPLQTQFWQIMDTGVAQLTTLRQAIYEQVKTSAYNTLLVKYKGKSQNITQEMIDELMTPDILAKEIAKNPEAVILTYLSGKTSVSLRKFQSELAQDIVIVQKLEQDKYKQEGDLSQGKWEFWITVGESQEGKMVQTEMASRWQVAMRA